jgi:hypothetical protein
MWMRLKKTSVLKQQVDIFPKRMSMLARKRKLGYRSFSDYLAKHQSEKS